MAQRPVFIPNPNARLVEERSVEFKWHPGFSIRQKRRSVLALHRSAARRYGLSRVLEVSTKSEEPLGRGLSAFNLRVPMEGKPEPILLEAAFQGSKVFRVAGGPFVHLYQERSGREVKRFMRQFVAYRLQEFRWEDSSWPLTPQTGFYDWLYIRALRVLAEQDARLDDRLCEYEAFTDIEFNPARSINCQARSCALYVSLLKRGNHDLDVLAEDGEEFLRTLGEYGYSPGSRSGAAQPKHSQESLFPGERRDGSG